MTSSDSSPIIISSRSLNPNISKTSLTDLEVGLLTGGGDRHYAFGLTMALVSRHVRVDLIGGDDVDSPEMHSTPNLTFLNYRQKGRRDSGLIEKMLRVLTYYARLIRYALTAKPKVLHILWNNKFECFDRTLLMLYYKALGKKIALTAHNINAATRDSNDTLLNRMTLGFQYRLTDHIFVHTEKMKTELLEAFSVRRDNISVIPYGINNAVPNTEITPEEAKRRLEIEATEKALLFFGNIAPYKGLEYLIAAFEQVVARRTEYRLIIAGKAKKGSGKYISQIHEMLDHPAVRARTTLRMQFIPDEDTELYFKAADVSILPYTHIFQSGVLFLGYSFGLPVLAADVGSLREDIIEGETGFVFKARDAADLANTIEKYFSSDLYRDLRTRREQIRRRFTDQHSWEVVGELTKSVYAKLLDTETCST